MMDVVKVFNRSLAVHFYVGLDQGFYKDEDIQPEVITGVPSYVGAKNVSIDMNALDSIAQVDSSVVTQASAEGQQLVVVGAVISNVVALAALRETGLKTPNDLEGKRIGVSQGSGEALLLPVLAKKHSVDMSGVEVTYLGPGQGKTIEQGPRLLISGEVDVWGGYTAGTLQEARYLARQGGTDVDFLKFGDFGIQAYEMCIVVNRRMIEEKPDLVRRFVKATFRAVIFLYEHPEQAADILQVQHPTVPRELNGMIVDEVRRSIDRPEVREHGLGWTDLETWSSIQELLVSAGRIAAPTPVDSLFTNAFLEGWELPAEPANSLG